MVGLYRIKGVIRYKEGPGHGGTRMDEVRPKVELEVVAQPTTRGPVVPALIAAAGDGAARRFVEFFTANIGDDTTFTADGHGLIQYAEVHMPE